MKTEQEIEEDVFVIMRDNLGNIINGKVYRDGTRPDNAQTEDINVAFNTGVDEQIQSGLVIVNIYVPNTPCKGYSRKIKAIGRIKTLQRAAMDTLENLENDEYVFNTEETAKSYPADDIEQWFINFRIHYKRTTLND